MTNNKPNDVLLPCPFCGQVPIITKHHREEMYSFMHRCEVLGPISRDFREDPADHVQMWNTRAQPADQQGEQMARMPVERCYDVRAKMIIAFNEAKKAGGDLDDHLDAAYKSALRFSPNPDAQPATAKVVLDDVFDESQWWFKELEAVVANGTPDQKRAVAVVQNLLGQIAKLNGGQS